MIQVRPGSVSRRLVVSSSSSRRSHAALARSLFFLSVQGGDPEGTGRGRSVSIYGGFFDDEISSNLKHNKRGILSMANSGKNTNASQFFITYQQHNHLNGKYTVFGRTFESVPRRRSS